MAVRPLEGRRIAVTRPSDRTAGLGTALERLGATVVGVPLVRIEPVEDPGSLVAALHRIEGYNWIVFTSANGVAAVGEHLAGRSLSGVGVAAVGPATAEAVRALGGEPSFVPNRFAADRLAAGLGDLEGANVLLPQGNLASPRLAEALRARGARVDAVVAYRTTQVGPSPTQLDELERGVDIIVLASGSAARSLATLASTRPGLLDGALVVCIGPDCATIAGNVGLSVGLVADEATEDGIVRALVSHFGESTP